MNKQEAIEKIKSIPYDTGMFLKVMEVPLDKVIEIVDQIHEPQKPIIPKFVAEWIEEKKKSGIDLHKSMAYEVKVDVFRYIMDNSEIYARAWLDGYEVEQEQLYTVEIPNPNSISLRRTFLGKVENTGKIQLRDLKEPNELCKLTEKEIKEDFEWAWQAGFAKEVTQ